MNSQQRVVNIPKFVNLMDNKNIDLYDYCHLIPDDTMFCRHRSDSGTHTLGSSASHSTSGNVELQSAFQPLQRSLDDCTIRKNVIAADCCSADAAACSNSKSMSDSKDGKMP